MTQTKFQTSQCERKTEQNVFVAYITGKMVMP